MMMTLTFTSYVDRSPAAVAELLSEPGRPSSPADATSAGQITVEVVPFADRSRVVVSVPWPSDPSEGREGVTLAAARHARMVNDRLQAA